MLEMVEGYEKDEEERGFLDDREKEGWVRKVKDTAKKLGEMIAEKERRVIELELEDANFNPEE
jgi:hypothetical protein